jgi:WD40 repeat protein
VWNLATRKLIAVAELPDIARAVAFSPNGQLLAVGLGGTVRGDGRPDPREFTGRVVLVSYLRSQLRTVHVASNALDAVSALVFSPDGSRLLVASLDNSIYVYDVMNNFSLAATLSGHTQGVRSLDLSADGDYLLSAGVQEEIVLWSMKSLAQVDTLYIHRSKRIYK